MDNTIIELQKIATEDKNRTTLRKREFPEEVKKRFDWDRITEQHLELYKKINRKLFTHNFYDNTFFTLSVKLCVIYLLPSPKI